MAPPTFDRRQLIDECAPELLRSVTRRFGRTHIRARGSSMFPAIKPGDILVVCGVAIWEVRLHDVILFQWEGRLLAHRVVLIHVEGDELVLTTRGDRHAEVDPPVTEARLIGRVEGVIRDNRVVPPEKWERAAHRSSNWWQ